MLRFFIFWLIIMNLLTSPSLAAESQVPDDPPVFLEGITVVAAPYDEEDDNTEPSHKTLIMGETLQERFTSIPEILSETVGVKINRFGGLGDFSAISIRGSSSKQVLIYLDGFLLNNAQGGGTDLARVPLSQVKRIEIYRGSAPIRFGQVGIGGVINIETKQATHQTSASAQIQYGSFNTSRFNTSLSSKPGKSDFFIGLNHEESDNDFMFLNDKGTQFDLGDDTIEKRENNQFESLNLISKIGYDLSTKNRLNLYHNFLKTDKGLPGLSRFQSKTANLKAEEHRSSLRIDVNDLYGATTNLKLGLHYARKKEQFEDRNGEIGINRQDTDNLTEHYEIRLNSEVLLGEAQTLKTLLQYKKERFRPFDNLSTDGLSTSRRATLTIGMEDQIAFFQDRLFLTPSILYDKVKSRFKGETFKTRIGGLLPPTNEKGFLTRQLGLFAQLTNTLSLRANIGRYLRPPSFFELFGDRGGTVNNPDLLPEKGLNRDIGLRYSKRFQGFVKKATVQAAYFNNVADNLIVFVQTSQFTARPENIGKSKTQGQELSGKLEIGTYLMIESNYTHQRAINHSPRENGKILPGRPIHEVSSKMEWGSDHYDFFYTHDFTDQNFLDAQNQRNATSRHIHNLGVSIKSHQNNRSKKSWSITLEAKNITDNTIEDVFGFPLPGRSYFITLQGTI